VESFVSELAASLGVQPVRIVDAASGVRIDEFDGARVPDGQVALCTTACGVMSISTNS
jgi:hypothetical protein